MGNEMDKQSKRQIWDQISLGWATPNTPYLFLYEALYSWAIPLLALTICYFHIQITTALITSWRAEIDLCLVDLPSFSAGIFPSALSPVSSDGGA